MESNDNHDEDDDEDEDERERGQQESRRQRGETNEIQANVEQPTDEEEIEEGGVEKNKDSDDEEEEEEEVEEEEEFEEEVKEEEEEVEEDDSTNRAYHPKNSRRAFLLQNPTSRSSRKRPRPATPVQTPTKRPKFDDMHKSEVQSMSSKSRVKDSSLDSSFWYDWDIKKGSYAQQENHPKHPIKATQVWRRLTSLPFAPSSGRIQQGVSPGRVNTLVKMVLAVTNGHAFRALKEVMTFIQRDERATMAGVFSQDPKVLVKAVNSVDSADNLNSYLRRFALARLARLYAETVANRGRLGHDKDGTCLSLRTSTNKAYKAMAYGRNKTRGGLIDSNESDAVRWNHYKRKLSKQIEAGQRWLKFADKFGWSALGLVTRDWFIEENKVLANDRIFEEIPATLEHGTLLDEIEAVKGRFLRQLNKTLGGSLFDLLEDSSRAQGLPLLKLDDHDILTRPDCDQSWLDDFHLEEK
ncbi:hypothetical protein LTR10_024174 [Elasticomyces elasticus]|nr:hypothetical protein LTR10_024174 [Elasticomyces elasticus]